MMVASLQNICGNLLPVAIAIRPDVKRYIFCSSISPHDDSFKFGEWKVPLEIIVSKIIESYPPRLLDFIPKSLVSIVALQMLKWADFYKSYFGLSFEFTHNFINGSFFTPKGVIDEEKIAKVLVRDNSLETVVQYKIACYYFMEETIIVLWDQLRESSNFKELIKENNSGEPFVMWVEYLEEKRKFSNLLALKRIHSNFVMESFCYGLTNKNVAAVKYCWSEKTQEAGMRPNYASWPSVFFRNCDLSPHKLLLSKDFEGHRNILLFFIRHLNRLELDMYLRVYKLKDIFKYLLFWPYQNFVMGKFESYIDNFKNCDHIHMVRNIVEMIQDPHVNQTYDYRNLLKKYLINRTVNPRNHIFTVGSLQSSNCYYIPTVPILENLLGLLNFSPEDEENISLISEFKHLHSLGEIYFIYKPEGNDSCPFLISLKDLQLNEEFLQSHTE